MEKALLGTTFLKDLEDRNSEHPKGKLSDFFLRLLEEKTEIWVVTTRTSINHESDLLWKKFIPEERILLPDPALGKPSYADSPALLDLWKRALSAVGVDCPPTYFSWLDLRHAAGEQGIIISDSHYEDDEFNEME